MKIIVVGGTGTIGRAITQTLSIRHDVVVVAHHHGDIRVDITNSQSIRDMYQAIGKIDAVIACTGKTHFATLDDMTADKYMIGLQSKLMGQVNLVLLGLPYLNDHGSFTLTSGILNHDPIRYGSSAAMVNGALEGFVKGAAIELPRHIRLNLISPTVISESMDKYADYFRGYVPVDAAQAAMAYTKSVEGAQTGQIYRVGY